MGLLDRLQHAWNAFKGYDPIDNYVPRITYENLGQSFYYRPDRTVLHSDVQKSIVGAIYNRIAIDCASVMIKHVRLDNINERYANTIKSPLNECLTLEANKDQTAKAFIRDVVLSMFEEGNIAVVPIDTDVNPNDNGSFDIYTMRVGKIVCWYPDDVRLKVYNDRTGNMVEITMKKEKVAIIENPLFAIMNEPGSVAQRLIRKLALLDVIDEQSGSGKLDLIVQLPYTVKTDARKKVAENRSVELESQLRSSKYGVAYIDGTEKITQLNRPVENNVMKSVEYLTSMLYSQLGVDESILKGTADEKTMLNYLNRSVMPVLDAITDEYKRKFLTKTARSQGQTIMYFNEPFKLVPISSIADIADKFTRNAIMSSNEMRQVIGLAPVNDPRADELSNKNLNQAEGQTFPTTNSENNIKENTKVTDDVKKSEIVESTNNEQGD